MLTAKTIYALRALRHLARLPGNDRVIAAQIKTDCALPGRFGETVLSELKLAGLIDSTRGPQGGYFLARPPEDISWADVIRAMHGPIAWTKCVSRTAPGQCKECPEQETCVIRLVMERVRQADAAILENLKIGDDVEPDFEPVAEPA